MNIEIVVAMGIFILVFSYVLVYSLQKFSTTFIQAPKLREVLEEIKGNFFSFYSRNALLGKIYAIPVLVKEQNGLKRNYEPIEVSIVFDENCEGIALNKSLRVYYQDRSIPLRIEKASYCFGEYLKNATILFPVSVSANSSKTYTIYFHNVSIFESFEEFEGNSSDWIPEDGDSWTEDVNHVQHWKISNGNVGLDSINKKVNEKSIRGEGIFQDSKISISFVLANPIQGISNKNFLRFWIYLNDTSLSNFTIYLNDSEGNYEYTDILSSLEKNKWILVWKRLNSSEWISNNFNASKGVSSIKFEAFNSTPLSGIKIYTDGLRFDKGPLEIYIYPKEEIPVILSTKLNQLRSESYEKLFSEIGHRFRMVFGKIK